MVCWGYNAYGQVGDNTTSTRATPVGVMNVSDAQQVHAGQNNTCVRRANGQIFCFGYNANGALGDGSLTNRSTINTRLPVFGLP